MASEFVYVLVAGVAVLVIGGVLAGVADETGVNGGQEVDAPVFSQSLGTIGTIEASSRTVQFGDATVKDSSPNATAATRDSVSVSASVLGASAETISFEAQSPRRAYISFVPSRSTAPENLVVNVNGEAVAVPEYEVGEPVTVATDNVQSGRNSVTFSAEKPGAAFWQRPSYTLQDVEIVVADAANVGVVEPFRAYQYEVEGFDRGEIRFSITEDAVSSQPLEIQINGNTVFQRTPVKRALPYTATFFSNTTDLSAGENVLSVRTAGDSSYPIDNLQLTLYFFAGTDRRTVERQFQIAPSDYRKLGTDSGRMMLEVDSVALQRPVTIELPNATFTRTLTAGTNTFTFGEGAVNKGQNTVTIATDGSYRVSQFNISVASE